MRLVKYLPLFVALSVTPSAAQQDTITVIGQMPVRDPIVIVQGDTTVVNVQVVTDSLALAIQDAQASLNAAVRQCDCVNTGTPWWVYTASLSLAAWGVYEFRQWARRDNGDLTINNVDVDVKSADHHHPPGNHKDGGHR